MILDICLDEPGELGEVTHPPYPDSLYRRIAAERGEILKERPVEPRK